MIGISQSPQQKQCLITELAPLGSLDNLLNQYEEDGLVPSRRVFVMALMQICSACEQLIEHGVIHCDLATRNCLVFDFDAQDESRVKVKLTDYGLTKEGKYCYGGGDSIPMRWIPPETIKKRRWSETSDVWALGVLMWEMWSMADVPFAFVTSDS